MTPQDRLAAILNDQRLLGFPPYVGEEPVVCLSQSAPDELIRRHQWSPWGVIVDVADVYAAGGGPVWYVNESVRDRIRDQLPPAQQSPFLSWTVRHTPTELRWSNWMHEGEWRIQTPSLSLWQVPVRGVIVGDPHWRPDVRCDGINPETGEYNPMYDEQRLALGAVEVERWWWNGTVLTQLQPWPERA